jgi:hypothetical protein
VATALAVFGHLRRKSIKEPQEALREAEPEVAAAKQRRDAAANSADRCGRGMKAAEEEAAATATRPAASRGAAKAPGLGAEL